jgi:hypothetical protein
MASNNQLGNVTISNLLPFYFSIMIQDILKSKPTKLFISIAAFFVDNASISECLGG